MCTGTEPMPFFLKKKIEKKKTLIAAHRGTKGGNIVENTTQAFDCAIKSGADIIELDVVSSTDGVLYVFHDGNEKRLLGTTKPIKEMSSQEIESFFYRNAYGKKTDFKVNRFADVLTHLKGETLINVDRCWDIFDSVIAETEKADMFDQIIFKCSPREPNLEEIRRRRDQIMFMPMVSDKEELDMALRSGIPAVAMELNFISEDSPIVSRESMKSLHERGILLWATALSIRPGWTASANHDDNTAITKDMYEGWGWLIDRGFDIIQSDWPMLLGRYISSIG